MTQSQKPFKRPPAKYQPKGLTVIYEDRDILVVDKVSGLLTVASEKIKKNTAYHLLTDYVRKGNPKSRNRIFIVHRLDRDTSGLLVFAKSGAAKRHLQDSWQEVHKTYYALVHGSVTPRRDVISSYVAENAAHKVYSVTNPKLGKLAKTEYRVLRESSEYCLLEIGLLTGRKNQIRVHLADRGYPVLGDARYGCKAKGIKRLMLHAASLTLTHPHSGEQMTFTTKLPSYFDLLMKHSHQIDH